MSIMAEKMEYKKYEQLRRDLKGVRSKDDKYEFLRKLGYCGMDGEQVKIMIGENFGEYDRPAAIHKMAKAHCFMLRGERQVAHVIGLHHMTIDKLDILEHCVHHGRIENPSDEKLIRRVREYIGGVADRTRCENILKGKDRDFGLEKPKKEPIKEKPKPKPKEPEKPKEPSPWDKLSEADKIYAMDQYKKTGKLPIESICKLRNCTPEEAERIQDAESEAVCKGEEMMDNFMKGGGMGGMLGMGGGMSGIGEGMGFGMPGMGGAMSGGMSGMGGAMGGGMPGMGGAMGGGMPGMGGAMGGGMPGMGGAMGGGMPGMGGAMGGGMPGMGGAMGGGMPGMGGSMGGGMPGMGMFGMGRATGGTMPGTGSDPNQQQHQNQGQQQQFPGMNTGGFPGF